MTYLGLRPWGFHASFEVGDNKLERVRVSVGGFKDGQDVGYDGLVPQEYDVISDAHPWQGDRTYSVGRPHVTGGQLEILQVHMMPAAGVPVSRAFDVNLHCLTGLLHGMQLLGPCSSRVE